MKCFEKLVLKHIKFSLPTSFDQHQYAYGAPLSTKDAIATALHILLEHPDKKETYVRAFYSG